MKVSRFVVASSLILSPALALADEVIFNNGDKLTGKIESTDGGKLTINTTVAGEVKVDLKDVKTFTTDDPVTLKFKDGTVLKDKVVATSQPGIVQLAGTGVATSQPVALDKVQDVNPAPVAWHGSMAIGGLLTRGNSDTDELNFQFDAVRRSEDDRITTSAGYLFGRQRDRTTGNTTETTNNGFALGKYDYFFTPKFYGYGEAEVQRDRIANLDLRLTPGAGAGYQWIERPTLNFSTEAGLSYVYENYTSSGEDKYVSARLAYHVDATINDRLKLFNDLQLFPSLESLGDFIVDEQAGVRFMLTKTWFSELKEMWDYNSQPAPGAFKNDLRWVLNVGWTF